MTSEAPRAFLQCSLSWTFLKKEHGGYRLGGIPMFRLMTR